MAGDVNVGTDWPIDGQLPSAEELERQLAEVRARMDGVPMEFHRTDADIYSAPEPEDGVRARVEHVKRPPEVLHREVGGLARHGASVDHSAAA